MKTLIKFLMVMTILIICVAIQSEADREYTTNDLINLFILESKQEQDLALSEYDKLVSEFENERRSLELNEMFNSFYDSAEAYQEKQRNEIMGQVEDVMSENREIASSIEKGILGDLDSLRRNAAQYDINLERINRLLEKSDSLVLGNRKALNISKLEELQERLKQYGNNSDKKASYSESSSGMLIGSIEDLQFPVEEVDSIASGFGNRVDRKSGTSVEFNPGLDFDVSKDSKVFSLFRGTVLTTGETGLSGKFVRISHGGGVIMLYTHLNNVLVSNGQAVEQYQCIGSTDASGLHVALYFDGIPVDLGILYE